MSMSDQKTKANIIGPERAAVLGTDKLIVASAEYIASGFRLINFNDPDGFSFYKKPALFRNRTQKIDRLILHWDVSRSSKSCFNTLLARGLSVHLMLDRDGTVYQALDLHSAVAKHAGIANARSVGIEICNIVDVREAHKEPDRIITQSFFPSGWKPKHLDFTEAQKKALVPLLDLICGTVGIPQRIPDEKNLPKSGFVSDGWSGVCGHYHIPNKNGKWDPGTTLWPVLKQAGFVEEGI